MAEGGGTHGTRGRGRKGRESGDGDGGGWGSFVLVLLLAVFAALAFRSFAFALFSIPSESMLPRLMVGDYLVAEKWPYGYSRYSLPADIPLISGRILSAQPKRGDVVIFKHPVDNTDYIKRVIALPGETVAVRGGQVIIDGTPIPRRRMGDVNVAMSANTGCAWGGQVEYASGAGLMRDCRYQAFRETLPNGRSYLTLDFGHTPQDDWGPQVVPSGTIFLMGDNRDNSQDSRFPAEARGGVGFVPEEFLVGRATRIVWSTDGDARWLLPWTWFTAARWHRIGDPL